MATSLRLPFLQALARLHSASDDLVEARNARALNSEEMELSTFISENVTIFDHTHEALLMYDTAIRQIHEEMNNLTTWGAHSGRFRATPLLILSSTSSAPKIVSTVFSLLGTLHQEIARYLSSMEAAVVLGTGAAASLDWETLDSEMIKQAELLQTTRYHRERELCSAENKIHSAIDMIEMAASKLHLKLEGFPNHPGFNTGWFKNIFGDTPRSLVELLVCSSVGDIIQEVHDTHPPVLPNRVYAELIMENNALRQTRLLFSFFDTLSNSPSMLHSIYPYLKKHVPGIAVYMPGDDSGDC
ncbi:hypothetical protein C8R46DRAFT_351218 [Mycena filopes]|nr:hypothetical protein C8R46DRAFT_351218 [Mycena filopes]